MNGMAVHTIRSTRGMPQLESSLRGFKVHYEAQGGLKVTFATTCAPQPTKWGTHMLS
jgi:hypothetical protein